MAKVDVSDLQEWLIANGVVDIRMKLKTGGVLCTMEAGGRFTKEIGPTHQAAVDHVVARIEG